MYTYHMRTPAIAFFLTLFLTTAAWANSCKSDDQANSECCDFFKSKNHTKTSRISTLDQSVCTVSVYNGNSDTSYRRFGFASDGQVSIFMQPGGNKQKLNSSQSYLIFPFGEIPVVKYNADEKLNIKSGSGQLWTFNTQNSLPIALEGCKLSVSPNFSLRDSGIKIQSCENHLVIETPVEVGGEYIAYPEKTLTVRDPNLKSCRIKNSDIYEYKKTGSSFRDKLGRYFNMKVKFKSNREMGLKLKKICPHLDVSMMLATTSNSAKPADTAGDTNKRNALEGQN